MKQLSNHASYSIGFSITLARKTEFAKVGDVSSTPSIAGLTTREEVARKFDDPLGPNIRAFCVVRVGKINLHLNENTTIAYREK